MIWQIRKVLTCVFIGRGEAYGIKKENLRKAIKTAIEQGVTLFLNGGKE